MGAWLDVPSRALIFMARMAEIFDADAKAILARVPFEWTPDSLTNAIAVGDSLYLVTGYYGRRILVKALPDGMPETVRVLWTLPTNKCDSARPRFRNEAGDFESPPAVERKNARKSWQPSKPPVIQPEESMEA